MKIKNHLQENDVRMQTQKNIEKLRGAETRLRKPMDLGDERTG